MEHRNGSGRGGYRRPQRKGTAGWNEQKNAQKREELDRLIGELHAQGLPLPQTIIPDSALEQALDDLIQRFRRTVEAGGLPLPALCVVRSDIDGEGMPAGELYAHATNVPAGLFRDADRAGFFFYNRGLGDIDTARPVVATGLGMLAWEEVGARQMPVYFVSFATFDGRVCTATLRLSSPRAGGRIVSEKRRPTIGPDSYGIFPNPFLSAYWGGYMEALDELAETN